MGTRADFYKYYKDSKNGYDNKLIWLGSIAYDGCPQYGVCNRIIKSKTLKEYTLNVKNLLMSDESATLSADGWPWPWDNSKTTDFSYCFFYLTKKTGIVLANSFGDGWTIPKYAGAIPDFPDMRHLRRQAPAGNVKSGIMYLGLNKGS